MTSPALDLYSCDKRTEPLRCARETQPKVLLKGAARYDAHKFLLVSRTATATKPGPGAVSKPVDVPNKYLAVVADNGKATMWRAPGTTTNAGTVWVMESTAQYPNGYVRFYNNSGPDQPIGLDGKTGPNSHTHIPFNADGTYPFPQGWGA